MLSLRPFPFSFVPEESDSPATLMRLTHEDFCARILSRYRFGTMRTGVSRYFLQLPNKSAISLSLKFKTIFSPTYRSTVLKSYYTFLGTFLSPSMFRSFSPSSPGYPGLAKLLFPRFGVSPYFDYRDPPPFGELALPGGIAPWSGQPQGPPLRLMGALLADTLSQSLFHQSFLPSYHYPGSFSRFYRMLGRVVRDITGSYEFRSTTTQYRETQFSREFNRAFSRKTALRWMQSIIRQAGDGEWDGDPRRPGHPPGLPLPAFPEFQSSAIFPVGASLAGAPAMAHHAYNLLSLSRVFNSFPGDPFKFPAALHTRTGRTRGDAPNIYHPFYSFDSTFRQTSRPRVGGLSFNKYLNMFSTQSPVFNTNVLSLSPIRRRSEHLNRQYFDHTGYTGIAYGDVNQQNPVFLQHTGQPHAGQPHAGQPPGLPLPALPGFQSPAIFPVGASLAGAPTTTHYASNLNSLNLNKNIFRHGLTQTHTDQSIKQYFTGRPRPHIANIGINQLITERIISNWYKMFKGKNQFETVQSGQPHAGQPRGLPLPVLPEFQSSAILPVGASLAGAPATTHHASNLNLLNLNKNIFRHDLTQTHSDQSIKQYFTGRPQTHIANIGINQLITERIISNWYKMFKGKTQFETVQTGQPHAGQPPGLPLHVLPRFQSPAIFPVGASLAGAPTMAHNIYNLLQSFPTTSNLSAPLRSSIRVSPWQNNLWQKNQRSIQLTNNNENWLILKLPTKIQPTGANDTGSSPSLSTFDSSSFDSRSTDSRSIDLHNLTFPGAPQYPNIQYYTPTAPGPSRETVRQVEKKIETETKRFQTKLQDQFKAVTPPTPANINVNKLADNVYNLLLERIKRERSMRGF